MLSGASSTCANRRGMKFRKVRRIVVRSLTEASHGNAYGIGMAAFCTTRLIQQIDREATRLNGLTSGDLEIVAPAAAF